MLERTKTGTIAVVASGLAATATFAFDLAVPLGVACGVPYVAVILLASWGPRHRHTLVAATACTALAILGYMLSPSGGELWKVVANRLLAVFAIWVTAGLCIYRRRAEDALLAAHDELEARVEERTADLSQANVRLLDEITERTRAERALLESEERYRRAVLEAPVPMMIHAEGDDTVQINKAWTRATGYTQEDIPTLADWTKRAYGDKQVTARSVIDRLYALDGPVDEGAHVVTTRSGDERTWNFNSAPLGRLADGRRTVIRVGVDVTERRSAQEAARRGEKRLALIQRSLRLVLYSAKVDGDFGTTWLSDEVERVTGFAPQRFLERADFWQERIHPEDRDRVLRDMEQLFKDGAKEFTYRWQTADGRYRWFQDRAAIFHDEEGNAKEIVGSWLDVTEEEEAKVLAHRRRDELGHVARRRAVGEMAAEFAHELNQPLSAIANYAAGCRHRLQSIAEQGDGLIKAMEIVAARSTDATSRKDPKSVGNDVSETEQPSSTVGNYANGCLRRLRAIAQHGEGLSEAVDAVSSQTERAGEIIRRLRAFVQKAPPRRASADLNALVAETIQFLDEDILKHRIAVEFSPSEDLRPVLCDEIQVQQVALNLLRNAIEAMLDVKPASRVLRVRIVEQERMARVEIRDNGPGISPGVAERAFDAFHSTKPDGMGIGLSISRALIEAHGGDLSIAPHADQGTVAIFTVPLAANADPPAPVTPERMGQNA